MAEDDPPLRGAGFEDTPRQLRAADFGCTLFDGSPGSSGVRQRVLIETLSRLEEASPTARYHTLARQNLRRWREQATPRCAPTGSCMILVLPGDWGEVTQSLTKEYGMTFASLNMANAYAPGGGYTHGMVAQEENMYRRTDCHFSLSRADMDSREHYLPEKSALLNAEHGRVYLDVQRPRVCLRGAEDRSRADLGYAWLPDEDVFPFYELRSAAVDLRMGGDFSAAETTRRIAAQLDTLVEAGVRHVVLSAFGCGAFLNPAEGVAACYRRELRRRQASFDVVAFAIFHAGYGPNNYAPFAAAFEGWPACETGPEDDEPSLGDVAAASKAAAAEDVLSKEVPSKRKQGCELA